MPHFDILRKSEPSKSFRVANVIGTYDLQQSHAEEHFIGDINLPEKWNVGLIVGRSGTGKTTIARELFGDNIVQDLRYTHDNILDDMPQNVSVNEICHTLCSVGFSSPVCWLKPYHVLSNGEKMRCDLARAMLENKDLFVFDEFTSVVDRTVAQIGSFAIQKAIRRHNKRFIAVTCHHDVQDWLMPDWVFNTDDMKFHVYDVETQKKNRPDIKLDIYEVETGQKTKLWEVFRRYHYLSHTFNEAAHVYVCTCNGKLAGFTSVLHFPHPSAKKIKKGHRSVVLPEFQGVGIGNAFTSYIAKMWKLQGYRYTSVTSNPSMIMARKNSKAWKCVRFGRTSQSTGILKGTASSARITASFEYIG